MAKPRVLSRGMGVTEFDPAMFEIVGSVVVALVGLLYGIAWLIAKWWRGR